MNNKNAYHSFQYIILAKILYGPKEKVGFQAFVYFRFFMKLELVHESLLYFRAGKKLMLGRRFLEKLIGLFSKLIHISEKKPK